MEAKKIIVETDEAGHLKIPLQLSPNTQFEVILLTLNKKIAAQKASTKIFGKGKIIGDILTPVIDEEERTINNE